jgi:hypothetical protein
MFRRVACYTLAASVAAMGMLAAGPAQADTDRDQEAATEQMVREAHAAVGMPTIIRFTERRFAKMILELRDKEIGTYTYITDMQGRLHFLCNSVGYGLPYSVQFTNPERYDRYGATLPQPDPNGLFMPGGLSATWVLCADPQGGEPRPVYSEPALMVSPFPLKHVSSLQP